MKTKMVNKLSKKLAEEVGDIALIAVAGFAILLLVVNFLGGYMGVDVLAMLRAGQTLDSVLVFSGYVLVTVAVLRVIIPSILRRIRS